METTTDVRTTDAGLVFNLLMLREAMFRNAREDRPVEDSYAAVDELNALRVAWDVRYSTGTDA